MNGYIEKQALMDYCSNQVTKTIDLNDIARFPIAEIFTKDEVIDMFTELQTELKTCEISGLWKPNYKEGFNDGVAAGVKKIQEKINELKGKTDGKSSS